MGAVLVVGKLWPVYPSPKGLALLKFACAMSYKVRCHARAPATWAAWAALASSAGVLSGVGLRACSLLIVIRRLLSDGGLQSPE